MPAAPVANPPWATGSWSDTAWEANTWGEGGSDGRVYTGSTFHFQYLQTGTYSWLLALLGL